MPVWASDSTTKRADSRPFAIAQTSGCHHRMLKAEAVQLPSRQAEKTGSSHGSVLLMPSPKTKPLRASSSPGAHAKAVVASSSEIKLNRLLAALPDAQLKAWLPHLELFEMPLGEVLYESGKVEHYVYFPTSSIVSLLYVMKNGDSAEIAVVGNEGIVGIALFMGGNTTPSRAVVQSGGKGSLRASDHRHLGSIERRHTRRVAGQRLQQPYFQMGPSDHHPLCGGRLR